MAESEIGLSSKNRVSKDPDATRRSTIARTVICIISGITVVAIIFPLINRYRASVKGNMRTIQIAVERYATDSGGAYPQRVEDFAPYLPGGSNSINGKAGTTDPAVSVIYLDWKKTFPHGVEGYRGKISRQAISSSNIIYYLCSPDRSGYAVIPGSPISNGTGTLVLSNQ